MQAQQVCSSLKSTVNSQFPWIIVVGVCAGDVRISQPSRPTNAVSKRTLLTSNRSGKQATSQILRVIGALRSERFQIQVISHKLPQLIAVCNVVCPFSKHYFVFYRG